MTLASPGASELSYTAYSGLKFDDYRSSGVVTANIVGKFWIFGLELDLILLISDIIFEIGF